jgi:hypothetical protein
MLGRNSNWVRNVRTAGGDAVLIHGRRRPVRLVEVTPSRLKAPIIKRYLLFAISARPHFDISWRAPLGQFEAIADDYPVFRIDNP